MLAGDNLIKADRMWRDEAMRKIFERETGLEWNENDPGNGNYGERFMWWAEDALLHRERCPKAHLSGPGGGCNYPKCDSLCSGRPI